MTVKPREVRQARTFHFRRGIVVSNRYCGVFVSTAKVMRVSFAQLNEIMHENAVHEVIPAFEDGIYA